MRHDTNSTKRFGATAVMAVVVRRSRVRTSYLGSRWTQAPIPVRREADT